VLRLTVSGGGVAPAERRARTDGEGMKKILKVLFFLVLVAGLFAVSGAGLAVWYFGRDLPNYQQLADYQPPIVSRVHSGDGRLMGEYAIEKRVFVPVKEMPPLVIHAVLAAEDKNFYTHPGIDLASVMRAAATDLLRFGSNRRPVGASTITQQVAKNFLLTNEVSLQRKVKEALIALRLEQVLSKDRILELYLNEIYLGGGAYGIAAAALNYFNKSLDELTLEEAAFLAALPKAPNNYNPVRFPEAAKARRDWVIDRMVESGFVTSEQARAAALRPIVTRRRDEEQTTPASYFTEEVRRELLMRYGEKGLYQSGLSVRTSLDSTLQITADAALRLALIGYDRRHGWRGPVTHVDAGADWRERLKGLTTPAGAADAGWRMAVVLGLQGDAAEIGLGDGTRARIPFEEMRWARKVLGEGRLGPAPRSPADIVAVGDVVLVEAVKAAAGRGAGTPPLYTLHQIPEVSGALVALDPHTGRVLAMTGGFSYEITQFNRATQAKRQTGSAIKPFIYLAAMDHGFTPSTLVLDAPFAVDLGPGQPKWKPENYTHKFYGAVPLRVGIEQSRNLMTARLGTVLGLDTVGEYVERFGIMEHMPRVYAMLLGAEETSPLKLTVAYAMLVNGGKRINPTFIDRVQDRNGATIYRADARPCEGCRDVEWTGQAPPELPDTREQIADPRSTYQIVSILQGVVDRGTGHAIASLGKPLAGKTGTTNDSDDTWFVGFSPDLAVGVFIGYDTPRSLGDHETGGSVAVPAFKEFMAVALKDKPAIPFRIPTGIRLVRVNAATGKLARAGDRNVIFEAFKPGTEPDDSNVVVNGYGTTDDDSTALGASPATPIGGDGGGEGVGTPRTVPASGTGGLY
jgi:penicillin-binding protein 1A